MKAERALKPVVEEFRRNGILMESDPHLPSVAAIVARGRIRGSWWGHPEGRRIWHVLNQFLASGDVLTTRLVSGKVTFVRRPLWPDLLAIATSHEGWQMRSLSTDAWRLLRIVERKGRVRTDNLTQRSTFRRKVGDAARELERRLLVHGDEEHTETGAHAKVLTTWSEWSSAVNLKVKRVRVDGAKARFEVILASLNKSHGAEGRLPWVDR